eukprot:35428_1
MEYVIAWIVMIIIGTKGSEEVIRSDWEWRDGTQCNVTQYPYVCTPANWWYTQPRDTTGCARFYRSDLNALRHNQCNHIFQFLCNNATLTTPRSYIYVDALKTADSADS